MKLILLAMAVLFVNTSAMERASTTPIQKVLELLKGMLDKAKKLKNDEEVQYAAFQQWCIDAVGYPAKAIDDYDMSIPGDEAALGKDGANIEKLKQDIADADKNILTWTGDKEAAIQTRATDKADYDATHKDLTESIDAIRRAIAVLQKQNYDRKQNSLIQIKTLTTLSLIPPEAKKAIDAFVQQNTNDDAAVDGLAVAAPEANAYEFQSASIIDMLQKLLDQFLTQLTTLEKDEMTALHTHNMLVQDLDAQIAQAGKDKLRFEAALAAAQEALGGDEAGLGELEDGKSTDGATLADLRAMCAQKERDFKSRAQLRADEIAAIMSATKFIESDSVKGNARYFAAVQTKASAFPQLDTDASTQARNEVVSYLKIRARQLNSRVLSALAVRASDDAFAKVRKLIKDLIVRLMEEANEEADHKGWCDKELSTNEQTRKEKSDAVETLAAEIDMLKASIASLTKDVAELNIGIAALDKSMGDAVSLRNSEKALNEASSSDARDGQTAVAQAIVVLKEFYAKAGVATAFLQQKTTKAQPAIFDGPYNGLQAENTGVLGMLEVLESDFARLESDTKAAEAIAQKAFDGYMTDSKVDKAKKEANVAHKNGKITAESAALTSKDADLTRTQTELDAALAYYTKLKPSCVDAGVTYEDRVSRRKSEVESLQEALRILNGEDIA